MKKIFYTLCRLALGFIIFFLVILLITPVFIPKFTEEFPTTLVVDGFYTLPEDNIDVLFLGSSQIMTCISPMRMYDQYGYAAYNLGTEQQNLVTSYYLLKEALAYQSPQVVILDVRFLFPYAQDSPLNSREEFVRKSVDHMKWSNNKWEFVNTICDLDSEQELRNYLFPFFRFHSRWSDLSFQDITYLFQDKNNPLKGFSISRRIETEDQFDGFLISDASAAAEILPVMEEYLYKIIELCQAQDISLILIKTPMANGSFQEPEHNAVQKIADMENLVFIDFNEKSVYDAADFCASSDYNDGTHINYNGACKITDYLADYLAAAYSLPDCRSLPEYEKWNADLKTYIQKTSG